MTFLSRLPTLDPAAREEIMAAYDRLQACTASGDAKQCMEQKEKFADLLNQSGLHSESREYYYALIPVASSLTTKSKLLRKVSSSFIAQREHLKAHAAAEEALVVLEQANAGEVDMPELFEALTAAATSNYFIGRAQRLKALVKEMRFHFPAIMDKAVRIRFYFVVMLDILLRFKWYMLPEESITHGELHLQFATETGNTNAIAAASNSLGFAHLWREEYNLARQHFGKALSVLQNRNFDMILISQVYTAVSYRMQNNIAMTEKWTTISLDVATKNENHLYTALSYGNLAWLHAKRGNWLYAEDCARKGLELLKTYRQPMMWLCIFPLLECLYKNRKYEEAGMYGYLLLHPSFKGLPPALNEKIAQMNACWVKDRQGDMAACLEEVISEAKLQNYF